MNKIVTLDTETDPFEYGEMVKPFLVGYYDGERIVSYWSDDCVDRLVETLGKEDEPLTVYVHNGGRFDFFYFVKYFNANMRIVNGRIIQAHLGKHEFRDSFAIMPFPLADYDKDSIDYEKFRREVREQHRDEILKYFSKDLISLHELVVAFHKEFGDKLTIGSASMKQIKLRHKFKTGSAAYDEKFRQRFYYGGRNQVFKSGITSGAISVYDVNSMYPFVMQSFLHPIGTGHTVSNRIEKDTCFLEVEGKNYGAFPTREKDNSLNFTKEYGIFYPTIHEWETAIATGCFKPRRIIKTYGWRERGTFEEFVTHFYDERRVAKKSGDKIKALFYKYVLNSGYGKFAQNPENYSDWYITEVGNTPPDWHECTKACATECTQKWCIKYQHDQYLIWERPLQQKQLSWYNVATGASITGAARAVLLQGIHDTNTPLYCDTDSIICCGTSRVPVDPTRIGAWDLEAVGRTVAIGGKKLYAIFDRTNPTKDEHCVKKAHKGARLTGSQILAICQGKEIIAENPVPNFRWDGTHTWTRRRIRMTG